MELNFSTSNTAVKLTKSQTALAAKIFTKAALRATEFLPLGAVAVTFVGDEHVAGVATKATRDAANGMQSITVRIHPGSFRFESDKDQVTLATLVTGEILKLARVAKRPDDGSVIETLVREGLAANFEKEVLGGEQQFPFEPSKLRLAASDLRSALSGPQRRKTIFLSEGISARHLGQAIVGGWSEFTGLTPSEVYAVSAKALLKPWVQGQFDIKTEAAPHQPRPALPAFNAASFAS